MGCSSGSCVGRQILLKDPTVCLHSKLNSGPDIKKKNNPELMNRFVLSWRMLVWEFALNTRGDL